MIIMVWIGSAVGWVADLKLFDGKIPDAVWVALMLLAALIAPYLGYRKLWIRLEGHLASEKRKSRERLVEVQKLKTQVDRSWDEEIKQTRRWFRRYMKNTGRTFREFRKKDSVTRPEFDDMVRKANWPIDDEIPDEELLTYAEYLMPRDPELKLEIKMRFQEWGNRIASYEGFASFLDKNMTQTTADVVKLMCYVDFCDRYGGGREPGPRVNKGEVIHLAVDEYLEENK